MTQDKTNKVSNVPPLRFPEFTEEWEKCTLGETCTFFSGGTPTSSNKDYYDGGISFIRSGEINADCTELFLTREGFENSSAKMVEKGDLLLALYGATSGEIAISKINGAINQAILCIRSSNNNIFVKSVWEKHVQHILQVYLQGGQGNLSADIVKKLSFYFPLIEEQNKIAAFISLLDKRIATQIRVIEDLQTLKKAIRKQIFSELLLDKEPNLQIKDVLEYEQPTKYLVTNTEYSDDVTLIPVLTANKAFILGYTDEINGIYSKGKCIILDDFTLDCKLVDFPFKVKSSAIKILTAKRGANIRYLYEYLRFLDLDTSEHKRHYIAEIEPLEIVVPDINMANDIANTLEFMDKRIDLAENMLSLYKQQKQFLLQQMFI